jgi:hypothetical protein
MTSTPRVATNAVALGVAAALALSLPARVARADDRASAAAILATLGPGAATDGAAKQARDALERGTRMRVAGDVEHARAAEGLALEWAALARDTARAVAAEAEARAAAVARAEAAARVEREQALLEEAISRSGRLKAELAALTAKDAKSKAKDRTSAVPASAAPHASPTPATRGQSAPPATKKPHVDADAPADPGAR